MLISQVSAGNAHAVIFNNHIKPLSMTHFYVDIDCHVNLIGPATAFGTENKSHYYDWRDFSMNLTYC
jgi:hypothetical protein